MLFNDFILPKNLNPILQTYLWLIRRSPLLILTLFALPFAVQSRLFSTANISQLYALLPHRPLDLRGRCVMSHISSCSAISCDLSAMQLLTCLYSLVSHSVSWNWITRKLYTGGKIQHIEGDIAHMVDGNPILSLYMCCIIYSPQNPMLWSDTVVRVRVSWA